MSNRFAEIYGDNEWGYGSGVGSLPLNNIRYMQFVQEFVANNNIRTVLDFGCGDWQFSQFIKWNGASYTGFDIVESVIERNQAKFSGPVKSFHVFTPGTQLPQTDLLICKDVFQHLPNTLVQHYLPLFKARSRFLLITNDDWPAEHLVNTEIEEGSWRPLRLDRAPFSEIAPVVLSWLIEWGDWRPTRKATCLIVGDRR